MPAAIRLLPLEVPAVEFAVDEALQFFDAFAEGLNVVAHSSLRALSTAALACLMAPRFSSSVRSSK